MKPSIKARNAAKHINECFTLGQTLDDKRIAEIIHSHYAAPTWLDNLMPEIQCRNVAVLSSGLVLIRQYSNLLLVFTEDEYKEALKRGKIVIRNRTHHKRTEKQEH